MEWKRLSMIKTARQSMANLERGSEQRASLVRLEAAGATQHGVYEPWRLLQYAGADGSESLVHSPYMVEEGQF